MREVATLPKRALTLIEEHNEAIRRSLIENLAAVMPRKNATVSAELVLTYFSGLCIEENLSPSKAQVEARIAGFLKAIRASTGDQK